MVTSLTAPDEGRHDRRGISFVAAGAPDDFACQRREMVDRQIRRRGIRDERVLEAMACVPRHLFVLTNHVASAYCDSPLPIGDGQTISQPYMVAVMAQALELGGDERVLEIGAGSGYQAAVLSLLAREVIAVETRAELAALGRERLARLGYSNARVEEHDGSLGWSQDAPYDAILVSAAAPLIPQPLIPQLKDGGRLVIPVGNTDLQQVLCVVKHADQLVRQVLCGCRYVPLIGRHGWRTDSEQVCAE